MRTRPRAARTPASLLVWFCLVIPAWLPVPAHSQQLTCSRDQCQAVIHGTAPAARRLRIQAHGTVTLDRGGSRQLSYTLKIVFPARDADQAGRILAAAPVHIRSEGGWTVLSAPDSGAWSVLSVEAPQLEAARIATPVGAVRADGVPGALEIHTGAGNVEVDRAGGTVTCTTGMGRVSLGSAGGAAKLRTSLGDILARQTGGAVEAETGGGDIRIGSAAGPVTASSGGGEISVGQAAGIVTLRNLAGPVEVGSAAGIRCESASGGISLSHVAGPVRVATSMGNIRASLTAGRLANSYLATGSGDITVLIPSNLGVTIQAEDDMADTLARIVSDFGVLQPRRQGTRIVAVGPVNGGGPLLQISGMGGTIFIKRQERPAYGAHQ